MRVRIDKTERLLMDLPLKYTEQMKELLGDDYEAFIASYDDKRHYGLRFNELKGTKEVMNTLPYKLKQVQWCPSGFYYEEGQRPAKNPYYGAGCYYIQEPSAMTPASVLKACPGEIVIDLCAAPGGKTTHIASDLQGEGLIVSNDISPSRVKNLNKNIQLAGIRNGLVLSEDPVKLALRWPATFDKVLVDAPCSGEGMFRKEPKLMASWASSGPEEFIDVQRSILSSAHDLLKPGGVLVYSTCTYNMEENEKNIRWFMGEHPEYTIDPVSKLLGISEGFALPDHPELQGCGRVWPHRNKGEGHFVARLIKGGLLTTKGQVSEKKGTIDKEALQAIESFMLSVGISDLTIPLDRLNRIKDTVYLLPEIVLETAKLRVFSNGWLLGTMKRGRFEPSQAFASGLSLGDVKHAVTFDGTSDQSVRYLKGETLPVEVENGWHLVTIEGMSLGWGKVVNKRLKNKLEPSWRWQ